MALVSTASSSQVTPDASSITDRNPAFVNGTHIDLTEHWSVTFWSSTGCSGSKKSYSGTATGRCNNLSPSYKSFQFSAPDITLAVYAKSGCASWIGDNYGGPACNNAPGGISSFELF